MGILDFNDDESLGKIIAVDTATVTVRVDELERLKRVQVNRLMAIRSSKAGQHLVGIVSRITRKAGDEVAIVGSEEDPEAALPENRGGPDFPDSLAALLRLILSLSRRQFDALVAAMGFEGCSAAQA